MAKFKPNRLKVLQTAAGAALGPCCFPTVARWGYSIATARMRKARRGWGLGAEIKRFGLPQPSEREKGGQWTLCRERTDGSSSIRTSNFVWQKSIEETTYRPLALWNPWEIHAGGAHPWSAQCPPLVGRLFAYRQDVFYFCLPGNHRLGSLANENRGFMWGGEEAAAEVIGKFFQLLRSSGSLALPGSTHCNSWPKLWNLLTDPWASYLLVF